MNRRTSTWIVTIARRSFGFSRYHSPATWDFESHELRELQALVVEHQTRVLEAWRGHFGIGGR